LVLALTALLPNVALALTGSQVYERVKDSVVVVKAYDRAGKTIGLGSGVVLPSGDIVTNYHVVKTGVRYMVDQRGKTAAASLKGSDPDKDLALLLAPGMAAQPVRLGQAAKLKVGQPVYAVGAPQGLELSLSEGIVSQLRGGPPPLIQTTVAISPGSSGGGLFNAQGELVGITTLQIKEGQNLNFALPVELLEDQSSFTFFLEVREIEDPEAKPQGNWHEKAEALWDEKDHKGLLDHSRKWTKAEPDKTSAWFYLGVALIELGRYQEAIEACREGMRLDPDDGYALYNLGKAYFELGRRQQAVKVFKQTIRLEPDHAPGHLGLGVAYNTLGRHREAVGPLKQAIRLQPELAEAHGALGVAYVSIGRRQQAVKAFKQAIRIKPDYPQTHLNLGATYSSLGHLKQAVDHYKEALRLKPDYNLAHFNLGSEYVEMGFHDRALEEYKILKKLNPELASKLFNLIYP
jgi:tetratricopeptide (TPR) repeat protein